ncbi:MAG: hypothetical protein ABSF35_22465 [Polyangia bacterium]|jgi:hypothetical protein
MSIRASPEAAHPSAILRQFPLRILGHYGGEMARAISGHVTEKMTEHYSHIDPSEKRAVVQGMLSLVRGGAESKPGNDNPVTDAAGEAEAGRDQTGTLTGTCPPETGTLGHGAKRKAAKPL